MLADNRVCHSLIPWNLRQQVFILLYVNLRGWIHLILFISNFTVLPYCTYRQECVELVKEIVVIALGSGVGCGYFITHISRDSLMLLIELSHLIDFKRACESSVQVSFIVLVLYYWLLFWAIYRLHVCENFSNINSLLHLFSEVIQLHDVNESLPSNGVSSH